VTTPLEEGTFALQAFTGTEALSTPFEFRLTMMSPEPDIEFSKLLNKSITVQITLADGTQRPFNGIVSSLRQKETSAEDLFVYEASMVPSLWLLALREDCRIFQAMSIPDIVKKILGEASVTFRMQTQGTYNPRDYCVQYRETTLNFISRLLEEEGIYYYFEHTTSAHTMVLTDSSVSAPICPNQATVSFSFSEEGWRNDDDGVRTLERIQQLHTGSVTLQDYNFETPATNLSANAPGSADESVSIGATGFTYDYPGEYGAVSDGETYAKVRIEERETEAFLIRGESRCRAFQPGYKFTLDKHFRDDTNQDYLLLSVSHDVLDSTFRTSALAAARYGNTYVAIPNTVPYRPARVTPKPIVQGVQTAVVVGPSGEEIWVDKYARVKVQFYWDRVGAKDDQSSCWVRVAQIWAGKNWGWITIPRIGQEVIVDFLEGDPDKPIITGRVYNADQMPPYTLPDNQTQSGIKSRSSKGGTTENFNEIRFEDKKDSEEIHINAEKDMTTMVEHDDTQTVKNDRTITVEGKHTETITKDTAITIDQGNHSFTMNQGNQTIELKQGNRTRTLDMGNENVQLKMGNQAIKLDMGNQSTKCDLGQISTEAMQSITLTVGGSSIKIDQMGVTIKGMMINVEGNVMTTVKGDAMLTLKGGITMIN
jgi:type VI secretion system secreted protein VgrG